MDPSLQAETEALRAAWMRHEAAWLRDYLVADVEDPRRNVQSILTRHFLLTALGGDRWQGLFQAELEFAAALNWLLEPRHGVRCAEDRAAVRYALQTGASNVEGIEVPPFLHRIHRQLPRACDSQIIPNYVEAFLDLPDPLLPEGPEGRAVLDTFQRLWAAVLSDLALPRPTVLEPACGSANDYRFLVQYGLARHLVYTGFDLCETNVHNARQMFPSADFRVANIFQIPAPDRAFEWAFVHDLFEHLSPAALPVAVRELCRVTARGLCVHFFQMDEIPATVVRPVGHYHWNLLSLEQTWSLFAREGFDGQAVHIGTFLQHRTGCAWTHNPNAYTFFLFRARP
ncbi:class I SAM-dependent methyltransferase [Limisphaera sp. VF-2]|jgi:SAM-dependent methyltransferase|uniref:class I SAM-dependent methyltransferase n=1 Tax=Limisphaera sp. VF-2 TaxID=3400418 RepID=UPI001753DADC